MSSLSSLPTQSLYNSLEDVRVPPSSPRATFTNWAGTYVCRPCAVFEPRTEDQCARIFELARREGKTVRAVGVGHSPSDLACTNEYMLRTTKLDKILEVGLLLDYTFQSSSALGPLSLHSLSSSSSPWSFVSVVPSPSDG